jgi:hypothetical protein
MTDMTYDIEIVLRHQNEAVVHTVTHAREPREWTEADAREVLIGVLLAVNRVGHPEQADPAVSLRGFSWIVEPFEDGGVVIALEIPMGAAVAGPFDADREALTALITRAIASGDPGPTIH